jgi:hypothetical protein
MSPARQNFKAGHETGVKFNCGLKAGLKLIVIEGLAYLGDIHARGHAQ